MSKPETKTISKKKKYDISVLNIIVSPHNNSRHPLSQELQDLGYEVGELEGKKDLWALGTSDDPEQREQFCDLIVKHDPELISLAATLLSQGQLQPVEVRDTGAGKYRLVFGHRRCLARLFNWIMLGKPKEPLIEAELVKGNDTELHYRSIVENIRKQPSIIEEAKAIKTALNNGQSRKEVAQQLGVSDQTIANRLKLLELSDKKQQAIHEGKISAAKAVKEPVVSLPGENTDLAQGGAPSATGTAQVSPNSKPRVRNRKELESARAEFSEFSTQGILLDWVLGRRDTIMPGKYEDQPLDSAGEVGSIPASEPVLGIGVSELGEPVGVPNDDPLQSTPEPVAGDSPNTNT